MSTAATATRHTDVESLLAGLLDEARRVVDLLRISSLSSTDVATAMRKFSQLRGVTDFADAALRSRARVLQPPPPPPGPGPQPEPPPAVDVETDVSLEGLNEASGLSTREGNQLERQSVVLEHLVSLSDALQAGTITTSHIRMLARFSHTINPELWDALVTVEDEILAAAMKMGPVRFLRFLNQLLVRLAAAAGLDALRDLHGVISAYTWIDPDTGLGKLVATLDPRSQAEISRMLGQRAAVLRHHDRALNRDQSTGLALVALLTGNDLGPTTTGAVSILIDHETLINGTHPNTICEHSNGSLISVDAAQEIACTATLTPILRDRWGVVLDLGRERRSTSSAQRRAIEAMYATCFMTGCEVAVTDCQIHHIVHWKDGGPTDLENLAPICQQHHHVVHTGGAKMSMDAQRTITVTTAIGEVSFHTPDRQPHRTRQGSTSDEDTHLVGSGS
jgi:hypothetical protein